MAHVIDNGIKKRVNALLAKIQNLLNVDIKDNINNMLIIKTKSGGGNQSAHTDDPWYTILENFELIKDKGIYMYIYNIYIWCEEIGCLWSSLYYI